MLNLLVETTGKYRTVDLPEAALYALLGFSIVFLGIAFLIFVVWLVGKIMTKTKTSKKVVAEKAPIQQTIAETESEEISEETVAVITAALMAYYQANNPKCEFTVKRIKRI